MSRELKENVVHENDDFLREHSEAHTEYMSNPPDESITAGPPGQDTAFGSPDQMQEAISSDSRQAASNHESDTESQNLSLSRAPCLATTEANYLSVNERDITVKREDDTKLLGKMLFEEDRKARSSFIAKVSEELKKKDMSRKVNLFEHRKYPSNESSKEVVLGEPSHNEVDHGESAQSGFKVNAEKAVDVEGRDEESLSSEDLEMSSSGKNLQTFGETERPDVLPTKKEATKEEDCTLSISAKSENKLMNESTEVATEQNQNDIMKNVLRNTGIETVILNQVTVVSPRECEAGCSDYNQILHQQQEDTQSGLRVKAQDEGAERVQRKKDSVEGREDYRNRLQEINKKEEEGNSRKGIRNNSFSLLTETLRLTSKEDDNAYLEGPWEQYLSNLNVSETDAGLWNSQSDDKQSGVVARNGKQKDDNLLLISGKEAHSEGWIKTTCRQFLDADVIADGDVTHDLPQTDQDNVDGPILTPKKPWKIHSNKAAMGLVGGKEATSGRSRSDFQRLSTDEPIKNGNPMPSEACDVVDGPVDPRRVDASTGYISPNFGGARPKEIFSKTLRNAGTSSKFMDPINRQTEKGLFGLDPGFVARHAATNNSLNCSFVYLNCNGATWEEPPQEASDDHYFSANYCNSNGSQKILGERSLQRGNMPKIGSKIGFPASEAFQEGSFLHSNVQSSAGYQAPTIKKDESWHFPPLPNTTGKQVSPRLDTTYGNQKCATQQNSTQVFNPLFDLPGTQSAYNEMVSMTNEFYSRSGSYGDNTVHSAGNSQVDSVAVSQGQQDSAEDSTSSLLAYLAKAMTKTVRLFASSANVGKHAESEGQTVAKMSVQEQANGDGENEHTERVEELNSREHAAPLTQNDQAVDTVCEDPRTPVQETPRPVCSHYQRRCLVSFPCCGKFYPCHRCHNDSKACSYDQARAVNATQIRCTICYHEQVVRLYCIFLTYFTLMINYRVLPRRCVTLYFSSRGFVHK